MLTAIHNVARTERAATCSLHVVYYFLTRLVFPSSSVEQSEEATGKVLGVCLSAGLCREYCSIHIKQGTGEPPHTHTHKVKGVRVELTVGQAGNT